MHASDIGWTVRGVVHCGCPRMVDPRLHEDNYLIELRKPGGLKHRERGKGRAVI